MTPGHNMARLLVGSEGTLFRSSTYASVFPP
jgi:hypothetical protein